MKLRQFLVGARRAATVGDIQASQRPNAVDAVGKSLGLVVRRLEIAPGLDLLADEVVVLVRIEVVRDHMARGVNDAYLAVVEGQSIVLLDDTHEQRGKVSEDRDLFAEALHDAFKPFQRALRNGESIGNRPKDGVPIGLGERLAHPPGNDPRGMDALPAQALDDALAELTQANAIERELGILLRDSKDVAGGRIGVHAEQQVGRREVEQAQSVRLGDLRQSKDAAKFVGSGRNFYRQQGVAGLGGRDQMADRADAADPRHQGRHLVKRTAFAQLLEAAELSHVKAGFFDPAVFVQVKRDLGMAFDARNRIDDDATTLLHEISLIALSYQLSALSFQLRDPVVGRLISRPKPSFRGDVRLAAFQ